MVARTTQLPALMPFKIEPTKVHGPLTNVRVTVPEPRPPPVTSCAVPLMLRPDKDVTWISEALASQSNSGHGLEKLSVNPLAPTVPATVEIFWGVNTAHAGLAKRLSAKASEASNLGMPKTDWRGRRASADTGKEFKLKSCTGRWSAKVAARFGRHRLSSTSASRSEYCPLRDGSCGKEACEMASP